jgi:lipopolysaccharide assembly outer membrane protein LptD (OstA)
MLGLLINNGLSKTLSLNSSYLFLSDSNDTFLSFDTLSFDTLSFDTLAKDSIIIDEISVGAPSFEVKYTAKDSIDFDNTNQIVYLFGEARVDYDNISLKANRIKVFIKKNEVHAFCKKDSLTGKILEKVVFTDDGESFKAPEMKYNFNTKKGRIIQATTQEGEMYLLSDVGKKNA